ncbi:MAG: DUF58 domain-containing protein [Allobranchiibius sp.]
MRQPSVGRRHDRLRLTTRGRAFLIVGACLMGAGLLLGYGDVTRIGALVLTLPLIAWALSASHATHLQLSRKITPTLLGPGDPATVRAVFRNNAGRASRLGSAQDRVDPGFGDRPRYTLTSIPTRGTATIEYTVRSQARGRHTIGPSIVTHPDPFGMCTSLTILPASDEIVVLPHTFPLERRSMPYATGGASAAGHSVALHGEQDVSIRGYVEGDELRRIHWPATAHRGQLMVRHEDQPEHRRALLWFDARGSAHADTGRSSSFEWMVSAVASIALLLDDLHYQLQMVSAATTAEHRLPSLLNAQQVVHSLALANTTDDGRHADLSAAAAQAVAAGSVLVGLFTDHPDPALPMLAATSGRGRTSLAIIVDTDAYRTGSVAPGVAAERTSAVLRAAGWRTAIAGPDTGIPAAWHAIAGPHAAGGIR